MSVTQDDVRTAIQELETSATCLQGDDLLKAYKLIKVLSVSPSKLKLTYPLIIDWDDRSMVWASPVPEKPKGMGSTPSPTKQPDTSLSPGSGQFNCPHCHLPINFSV